MECFLAVMKFYVFFKCKLISVAEYLSVHPYHFALILQNVVPL